MMMNVNNLNIFFSATLKRVQLYSPDNFERRPDAELRGLQA
jgi:hypothetical protein